MALNTHSLDLEEASSQYAKVADNAALSLTGDMSMECWFKPEQLVSVSDEVQFSLINKWRASAAVDKSYLFVLTNADKALVRFTSDNTNLSTETSDAAILVGGDVGNWVHLACTIDVSGPTILIYKNGSPVASSLVGSETTIRDGGASFAIGALDVDATPALFVDGMMDEVRMWSDVRSGAEITANKDKRLVGNEAGLVGYWRFNNNYNDSSPNSSTLTPSGSPVFSTSVPFPGSADIVGGNPMFFGGGLTLG